MSNEARGKGTLIILRKDFPELMSILQDEFSRWLTTELNSIDPDAADLSDIKSAMSCLGFEISFDGSGNIGNVIYPWHDIKTCGPDRVLEAIGELAQDGSMIEIEYEDGDTWIWPEQQTEASEIDSDVVTSLNLTIDASDPDRIISDVSRWISDKGYDLDLDESGLCEMLESLLCEKVDVYEDEDLEQVTMEGTILFVEICYPIAEFLEVIAPYVVESDTTLSGANADYIAEFEDGKVSFETT